MLWKCLTTTSSSPFILKAMGTAAETTSIQKIKLIVLRFRKNVIKLLNFWLVYSNNFGCRDYFFFCFILMPMFQWWEIANPNVFPVRSLSDIEQTESIGFSLFSWWIAKQIDLLLWSTLCLSLPLGLFYKLKKTVSIVY